MTRFYCVQERKEKEDRDKAAHEEKLKKKAEKLARRKPRTS